MMPTVSIVLPTYNGSKYLRESLDSCLAQSFTDWELIIVDDHSTDETPTIIAEYVARDPRIRSVRNDPNQKLPRSLNIGFAEAKGKYFTWTSDDNAFRENALERMVKVMDENPDVGLVYAHIMLMDENGKETELAPVAELPDLTLYNCVRACFMYKREVHEQLGGYDPDWFLVEDWDFWLRAAAKFKLMPIYEDLYLYREHGGSLTSTRRKQVLLNTVRMIDKNLPEQKWMSTKHKGLTHLHLAANAWKIGERGFALRHIFPAFFMNPGAFFAKIPKIVQKIGRKPREAAS